jgi:hypothetical protein
MAVPLKIRSERSLAAVPRIAKLVLVGGLCLQVVWQAASPKPVAEAAALDMPAKTVWLRVASLGEPIAFSQLLLLYLQAFDSQPGISVPFMQLDYRVIKAWLAAALDLDYSGQYPLMMAAHLYARVPDQARTRYMLDFVHQEFLRDPERRWRWLAHAAIVAKHRLKDMPLALRYAEDITSHAGSALNWARQMRIFILEDMGEVEAATILLGGLLASGEVTDEAEIRFLTQRLDALVRR